MANHTKPTKAQMQAEMDRSLKILETLPPELKTPVETPPVEPPVVTPVVPPTVVPPVTPPVEPPQIPVETPPVEETSEQKIARLEKEAEDAKKKFSNSSREAQVLGFKDKEMAKAQEEADLLQDPTDDEMKEMYADWDDKDQLTRDLAKDRVLNRKKLALLKSARDKFKNVSDWNKKVDTYIEDPTTLVTHPELEGKIDDFKLFASKETRQGVEFDDLVLAFSGEQAKAKPAPSKGQMFEPGSGGPAIAPQPKDSKLSLAEGDALRKSDYKAYLVQLKAGNIRQE